MSNETAASEPRSDGRTASYASQGHEPSEHAHAKSMNESGQAPFYLADWLRAYETARSKGAQMLGAFAARLADELRATAPTTANQSPAEATSILGQQPAPVSSGLTFVNRWLRRRRQRSRLRQVLANPDAGIPSLVALSARRSPIEHARPLRGRLRKLMRGLPGVAEPDRVARAMCDGGPILLFETCRRSTLWNDADKLWDETVFIVDYDFLAFVLASNPTATLRAMWKQRAHLRAIISAGGTWRSALAAWALDLAYGELLTDVASSKAFLLISNCFATEVLRVFLLHSTKCATILEVLHGVPTLEFEVYFRTLLYSGVLKAKQQFVVQAPTLPMYGLFAEPGMVTRDFAINTAFNKYSLTRINSRSSTARQLELECERVLGVDLANPPLVVAWMGANSHDRRYFSSGTFSLETALIRHVLETLRATQRRYVVFYTPHPLHSWSTVSSVSFFAENDIVLHPDTIFTWVIADLCLGLYSSGLFEARFAGVVPFTPLLVSDAIYPPRLLGQLRYPHESEGTLVALSEFVRSGTDSPRHDMRVRIRERAARLFTD